MRAVIAYAVVMAVFVAGVLLILGAYRRWKWLVDPPEEMWPYYSQALIKRLFGTRFLVLATYAMGVALVAACGVIVYVATQGR